MQASEIEAKVNQIMVDVFEVDPTALRPEAHLGEDLGLDSLDGVDLVVALEKAFRCRIAEHEARAIRHLRDIYRSIAERLASASSANAGTT